MKLTRELARKQAKRILANAMLTPQSDDGIVEIIDCLLRHCDSPEHAERTMTRFLDTASDPRNVTAEIAGCAQRVHEGVKLPPGCPRCQYGENAYLPHVAVKRGDYEASARCPGPDPQHPCPRGRALRDADRRRDAELEAMPLNRRAAPPDDWPAGDSE